MKLTRRKFNSFAALGLLFSASPGLARTSRRMRRPKKEKYRGLSILQGATDDESTQFSIMLPRKRKYTIEVESEGGQIITPAVIRETAPKFSKWKVFKVYFDRLWLGETFK